MPASSEPARSAPAVVASAAGAGAQPRRLLRENGLTLTLLALFALALIGQAFAGYASYNGERTLHRQLEVSFRTYLTTGDFLSAVFENWESEFLQMGALVLLTVFLRQKGSPESLPLESEEEAPAATDQTDPKTPWPVRKGGVILWLYAHSLSIALFLLFITSMVLHAVGSASKASEEAARHGGAAVGLLANLCNAEFWFESFQNWQSEFLAMAVLVVLGIYLRERGSPESKPVAAPHEATGR